MGGPEGHGVPVGEPPLPAFVGYQPRVPARAVSTKVAKYTHTGGGALLKPFEGIDPQNYFPATQ